MMGARETALTAMLLLCLFAIFRAMVSAMVQVCTWVLVVTQP